ncbi:hypothetical protein [Streptomyces sp. NPDC087300]|uniref:hypothetical protein n=1 Tax=Streptomyces sp. NPDC087300 TaxID=3365780 RepID=UPI00380AF2AB
MNHDPVSWVLAVLLVLTGIAWCSVHFVANHHGATRARLCTQWMTELQRSADEKTPAPGPFEQWPGVPAVQARLDRLRPWEQATTIAMTCTVAVAGVMWFVI